MNEKCELIFVKDHPAFEGKPEMNSHKFYKKMIIFSGRCCILV